MGRDIPERITTFNAGRDPERLVRKYDAMRADPFVFFRGTAHLFWEDWPRTDGVLRDAPAVWACGDLHLENFGSFRGDNRLVYFDLNDFDEAGLAPATADPVRLLASTHLAAHSLGLNARDTNALCGRFVDAYRAALADGKARWVERATATGMVRDLLQAARDRSREDLLDRRTVLKRGRRRLRIDGEHMDPISKSEKQRVAECISGFAEERGLPRRFYEVIDVAARIAGTGSLGIRRYVALVRGRGGVDGNYLLDLKAAAPSSMVLHVAVRQPAWRNEAERVVEIQHHMQAVSPALLSAVLLERGHFVLRELQPLEDRLALEHANGRLSRLKKVLRTMGHLVGWSQLRSASRQGTATLDELIEFGRSRAWCRAALDYARSYAQIAREDWKEFVEGTES